jgi:hypothetical protein
VLIRDGLLESTSPLASKEKSGQLSVL